MENGCGDLRTQYDKFASVVCTQAVICERTAAGFRVYSYLLLP